MNVLDQYYKSMHEAKFWTDPKRLQFYLEEQLFKGIDFKGKTLIDIGGGNGLFAFYAAINGAKEVVVMEPEFDGSTKGMIQQFQEIKTMLGLDNISHTTDLLEDFDRKNNQFDYILMHNSINHIDEEACIVLKKDTDAQNKYLEFFECVKEISERNTKLIICDCSRKNFFPAIGMTNPLMKSIEWEKHQHPQFWASLLAKKGFNLESIRWNSPNAFGKTGKVLFANALASYMTLSHFRLEMSFNSASS